MKQQSERGVLVLGERGLTLEESLSAVVWRVTETTKTKDKHMKPKQRYVGLDVHKDTITIAVAEGVQDEPCGPMARIGSGCWFGSFFWDLQKEGRHKNAEASVATRR
ncbi:MAG: hypothetical protein KIT44_02835 [Opitutaceae bacterium]|nr:hypothetical protein [Opitutaceae bacterium]